MKPTDASDAERDAREWWNAHWTQSDGAAISSLAALLRQREEGLRATNARLNRRCQESEKALGDLTKHPSVNQSRTGRMSYAVMSVAVRQANEQIEALNARVAQLTEALEAQDEPHDMLDTQFSAIHRDDCRKCSLKTAALSGTGTDWLAAHDAQVRRGCSVAANNKFLNFCNELADAFEKDGKPISAASIKNEVARAKQEIANALGSADAPGGEKG